VTVANPGKEGLPYWILWLLVSVILLLVFYIFLRDKDLRFRLSSFLAGPKRRMLRLRLQVKLKKEHGKKAGLWRDLGRAAWSDDIRSDGTAGIFGMLTVLESDLNTARAAWHEAYTRIESMEKARASDDEAGLLEIHEWTENKEAVQERIIQIRKSSEPLYESLGKILAQSRPDHESLALYYFQLDRVEKIIRDLQSRIEKLS
jgi:hypothetical protein